MSNEMEIRRVEKLIKQLKELAQSKPSNYEWTRDEIRTHAPLYEGPKENFSMDKYIEKQVEPQLIPLLEKRTRLRKELAAAALTTSTDITEAARTLFHSACPHSIHYRKEDGKIDIAAFDEDLQIWLVSVSAMWMSLTPSEHDDRCTCCVTFRRLATIYESYLKSSMDEDDYYHKRVCKQTICRWADGISDEGAKEAFADLASIAKSLIRGEDHPCLSDNVSDAEEEEGVESTSRRSLYNPSTDDSDTDTTASSGTKKKRRRVRRRKVARRPLQAVYELSDIHGVLDIAIPEVSRVIKLYIPANSFIGREGLSQYAKSFLSQLLKITQLFAFFSIQSYSSKVKRINKDEKDYRLQIIYNNL